MKDCKGIEVELDQIVKHEDLVTGRIEYFHVQKRGFGYLWLLKYDKKGNTEEGSLNNIKIDTGVDLINDDESKWTVLGTKEEVYDKIFKQ